MKFITSCILLFMLSGVIYGQQQDGKTRIRIAYLGAFAIHPGLSFGTQHLIKSHEGASARHALILQPRLGIYTRSGDHTAILADVELGWRRQGVDRKSYAILSIGMGYLAHLEVISQQVDLSGKIVATDRERWDYALLQISYTRGWELSDRVSVFGKVTYGNRRSDQHATGGILLTEAGLSYSL